MYNLENFINKKQLDILNSSSTNIEKHYFLTLKANILQAIRLMPVTFKSRDDGDNAIAYLHYFDNTTHWYVTEKDVGCPSDSKWGINPGIQLQAYGFIKTPLTMGMGYINIQELITKDIELDLFWMPMRILDIKTNSILLKQ